MSRAIPVETRYGVIDGRGSLFIDEVRLTNRTNHLHLYGAVNGRLCSQHPADEFVPYALSFEWVLAFRITELDTWESQRDWYNASSFDPIEDSVWLAGLGGKKTPEHRHYIVIACDDVVEVVCKSYRLEFGKVNV